MNKKQVIIMAGIGLISFALSFTVGLFTNTPDPEASAESTGKDKTKIESLTNSDTEEFAVNVNNVPGPDSAYGQANLKKSLTEKQLKSLIFDIRSRISAFQSKEKELSEKEIRVEMANEELRKNIDELEELRLKLTSTLSAIKQKQKVLDNTLVKINQVEKKNILKAAAIYDKMKPQQASEIFINLSQSDQLGFAVKLAYYMTERTSANLIAEISKTDSQLAATISDKLRYIEENNQ